MTACTHVLIRAQALTDQGNHAYAKPYYDSHTGSIVIVIWLVVRMVSGRRTIVAADVP